MLASERHQQILRLLDERGSLRTVDLAQEFSVTDETVRRDLQLLADGHHLTRTHGGATCLNGRPKLQSFAERRGIRVEQKSAIAKAALSLIEPGRTYAFDSSTTSFELVRSLPDLSYRVVTNAYAVIDHLIRLDHVELISTGGRYHQKTQTFVGSDSVSALRRFNINTAFVSCVGLDAKRGASEAFEEQAGFKQVLVDMADDVVLLADSRKLGKCSEYFFGETRCFSRVITDLAADVGILDQLRDCGCEVIIAE
ncbi:DeoR/GlpR family DNA-binding transcription regulator [Haloferula sp.]|uniref:DeoR/GlpR family DNA-binding transcription regulator n=1 Tax=Haloferula sp. TaxID=2497595 RepID=UPI003C766AF1